MTDSQATILRIIKRGDLIETCSILPRPGDDGRQQEQDEAANAQSSRPTPFDSTMLTHSRFQVNLISLLTYGSANFEFNRAIRTSMSQVIFDSLIEKHFKTVSYSKSEECEVIDYEIDELSRGQFQSAIKELIGHRSQSNRQAEFLLVTAHSELEFVISSLLQVHYTSNPSALNSSEKQFSMKDIFEAGGIEEFKQSLLSKEVQSILRDSTWQAINALASKSNFKFEPPADLLERFKEICERRNLIVHHDGICNEIYIRNTQRSDVKIGDKIGVSMKYLRQSVKTILEIGVALIQIFLRKNFKDKVDEIDGQLIDLTYNLNSKRLFDLTIAIGDYWASNKNQFRKLKSQMYFNINYIYALVNKDEIAKAREVDSRLDWSVCDNSLLLCRHSALKNEEECVRLVSTMSFEQDITFVELSSWPVFSFLRETPSTKKIIEGRFGPMSPALSNNDLFEMLAITASKLALKEGIERGQKKLVVEIEIA